MKGVDMVEPADFRIIGTGEVETMMTLIPPMNREPMHRAIERIRALRKVSACLLSFLLFGGGPPMRTRTHRATPCTPPPRLPQPHCSVPTQRMRLQFKAKAVVEEDAASDAGSLGSSSRSSASASEEEAAVPGAAKSEPKWCRRYYREAARR